MVVEFGFGFEKIQLLFLTFFSLQIYCGEINSYRIPHIARGNENNGQYFATVHGWPSRGGERVLKRTTSPSCHMMISYDDVI